jgi:hypothetical protein
MFGWLLSEGANRGKGALDFDSLGLVSLFSLLVFTPAAAYFIAFEPDWAYAYLIDSSRHVGALHAAVVLCDVASVPLGFVLSARSGPGPAFSVLMRLAGVPLLSAGLFVAVLFPRLSVQATYAQFHGDFGTRPIAGTPLGYAVIWMLLVLSGAAAWMTQALRRLR